MTISIVMTAHKRAKLLSNTLESIRMQTRKVDQIVVVEDGFDGGITQGVCINARNNGLPVEYYCRKNRPRLEYSNPSIPKNIGIRKATGDILIIQCAEVMYTSPTDVENLVRPVEENASVSSFALVKSIHENGAFHMWYAGPERGPEWFLDFCQAVRRDKVVAIGGFDEGYIGYGFDDDCFAYRLQASGVKYQWAYDVVAHHQWHPIVEKCTELSDRGRFRYQKMKKDIEEKLRTPEVNIGIKWGDINS